MISVNPCEAWDLGGLLSTARPNLSEDPAEGRQDG